MPRRFVILKHDHPFLHWDLLLEEDGSARTWRLLRMPCLSEPIAAEPLPSHRLAYLEYEGPVSDHRGQVQRVFSGSYVVQSSHNDLLSLTLSESSFACRATVETLSDGRVFITFAANSPFPCPSEPDPQHQVSSVNPGPTGIQSR